jgi:hypothetical protein
MGEEFIFSGTEPSGCATSVFVSSVVEEIASRSKYFYEKIGHIAITDL